jgi:serine/threonine-protein kinase
LDKTVPQSPDALRDATVLWCSACGQKVRAVGFRPGMAAACKKCGGPLTTAMPSRAAAPGSPAAHPSTKKIEPTPPDEDPILGKVVGGCAIESRIGRGGMGAVYRGRHVALDKTVAIKVLPPEYLAQPTALERFQREARAAAKLEHPNVVQVLNVGNEQGYNFIVMQFVEGQSLGRLVSERKALPWQEALRFVRDAARALEAAHRVGIVHRDIKPDNILVSADGAVKVADFGLARTVDSNLTLSTTGQIMGTPDYMSPEQAQGLKTDGRSDIYSLGATFFFLLTFRKPFVADTPVAVILKHVSEPPKPARQVNPAVPEAVSRVVEKMMAKRPEDRFADCSALIGALDALERGASPVTASDLPPPQSPFGNSVEEKRLDQGAPLRRNPLVVSAIATLALLAIVIPVGISMKNRRKGGASREEPATGTAGIPAVDPPAVFQPPDREPEAAKALEELRQAAGDQDWAAANRAIGALDTLRDTKTWADNKAEIERWAAAAEQGGSGRLHAKVELLPGGINRYTWEFSDKAEQNDFNFSPAILWSVKPDTGTLVGTSTFEPMAGHFKDGLIAIQLSLRDFEFGRRKPPGGGNRPKLKDGLSDDQLAILVRMQPGGSGYGLGFDMTDEKKPRAYIGYIARLKPEPEVSPIAQKEVAALPDSFEFAVRTSGGRLSILLDGKAILEGTDTRVSTSGAAAVNFKGMTAHIDRLVIEKPK